jgi:hypothetical protein
MRRNRLLTIALSLGLLATTSPARAVDPTNKAEAIALFNEGGRLSALGDFEHARLKFLAASAIVKAPNIWWNIGYSEYRSGHYVDGLRHLRKYFRLDDVDKPKHLDDFNRDVLPMTLKHVGQLTIDTAPDALVTIDDKDEAGRAPFADPVAVLPGKHHVVAHRDNESVTADVEVSLGATATVTLAFKTPPPPASSDDLTAMLDRSTDTPSSHPASPEQAPPRSNPAHLWLPLGLAVVGAASLGLGIGFGAQSNSAANDAQNLRAAQAPNACRTPSAPGCAAVANDVHSQNTNETVSIVMYSGAGALLAAAFATWLWVPRNTESRSVAEPLIGPGTLGARWTTKF